MNDVNKVLILAPHTDDGEFGCGGTIAKFIEDGALVRYVAFSIAEDSVPSEYPKDVLYTEAHQSAEVLGVKDLIVHRFPVRCFLEKRQQILEIMVKLNESMCPDIVFAPSRDDTHQDHQVIAAEAFRAFKKTTILGYEIPWNNLTFHTNAFLKLKERHLNQKINALKCYISQMGRSYVTEEFVMSLAKTRGAQIGEEYAETFEVVRLRL